MIAGFTSGVVVFLGAMIAFQQPVNVAFVYGAGDVIPSALVFRFMLFLDSYGRRGS